MATRLGTGDPGRDGRVESPHLGIDEVFWRLVPLRSGGEPVREAGGEGGRGGLLVGAELPRDE
jgi:hypothetical protein